MTCGRMSILCTGVLLAAGAGAVSGKDWPEWCGQPSRNMAAKSDQRLPDWADCGVDNDAGEVDLQSTKNVKWVAKLGRRTTGSPVVSGGRVFIGTTWEDGKEACFLCLDEETGRRLGSFICPRPPRDNLENWAISSTPTVEGDRLYFVSPYQEAMCIDLKVLLGDGGHREGEDKPQSRKNRQDLCRTDIFEEHPLAIRHVRKAQGVLPPHGKFLGPGTRRLCLRLHRQWTLLGSGEDTVQSIDPQPGRVQQDDGTTGCAR